MTFFTLFDLEVKSQYRKGKPQGQGCSHMLAVQARAGGLVCDVEPEREPNPCFSAVYAMQHCTTHEIRELYDAQ